MAWFTINGARYEVPTTLTYGEQIDIYKEFGQDAAALGVIWIAVRRQHPRTTIEDLRNATVEMEEDEEEQLPPTSSAAGVSAEANGKQTEPASIGSPGSVSTSE